MLAVAAAPHCIERISRRVEDGDFHRGNHPWVKAKGRLTSKRINLFEILPRVTPGALVFVTSYLPLSFGLQEPGVLCCFPARTPASLHEPFDILLQDAETELCL